MTDAMEGERDNEIPSDTLCLVLKGRIKALEKQIETLLMHKGIVDAGKKVWNIRDYELSANRLEQENKELRTRVAGAYEQGKKDGKIESFELAIKIAETFEPEERQTYIKYASDAIRELKRAVKESRT